MLEKLSRELKAYQTKFYSSSHSFIRKSFYGAKFVIEGSDTLADSHITLQKLMKDWMLDTKLHLVELPAWHVMFSLEQRVGSVFTSQI